MGRDSKKKSIALLTMELEQSDSDSPKAGEEKNEEYINQIESMLVASDSNKSYRITYPKPHAIVEVKPYYPRPFLVNLKHEDTNSSVQYDKSSIISWNIDGQSNYQIKNVLQYMTMYATTSQVRED